MASKLRIIPLGGVGEIGKNLTVIEYGKDMGVVDCGLIFPDDDMPGIDLVIPDMTYLEKNAEKLRGFLITHGHEDHIGALPFALQKLEAPVYGTRLTIALIQHKLEEAKVKNAHLNCVSPGDTIRLGCFNVEFIKTSHSIAGACALAINTPIGTIIHTGDYPHRRGAHRHPALRLLRHQGGAGPDERQHQRGAGRPYPLGTGDRQDL